MGLSTVRFDKALGAGMREEIARESGEDSKRGVDGETGATR